MEKQKYIIKKFGVITYVISKLFFLLKFLPPQVFVEERIKFQIRIADLSEKQKENEIFKRMVKMESIIVAYVLIYIASFRYSETIANIAFLKVTIITLLILRIIDVIQMNVNMAVFDSIRSGDGTKADNKLYSLIRAIVIVSYNYIEMAIIFALLYSFVDASNFICHHSVEIHDKLYFSFITQLTIGYGEITPYGMAKILTMSQGLIGYFFTILIISRLLSSLPRISSKEK